MNAVKTGQKPIESVFASIPQLRQTILKTVSDPEKPGQFADALGLMTEGEYIRFKSALQSNGLFIERNEAMFVEPDPEFFLRLAGQVDDRADAAFFTNYKATYPFIFPAYESPVTGRFNCLPG
jgi:hypothetical protein